MRFTIILAIPIILSFSLNAALPVDREELASDIASGYVTSVKKTTVSESTTMVNYKVRMIVTKVFRGDAISSGQTIEFSYRRKLKGPAVPDLVIGQSSSVKPNTKIRAYMRFDPQGQYTLLEPNGFDNK